LTLEIYQRLSQAIDQGQAVVLCTIVESHGSTPRHEGSKMLVFEGGSTVGTVGGGEVENRVLQEALSAMKDGKNRLLRYNMVDPKAGDPGVCGGQLEVYVEPVLPKPIILIIGGGHVGKAVAHLAHWLGFKVVVSDDRPDFCTPESNPDADEFVVCPMAEIPARFHLTSQTYIILTSRGAVVDIPGLPPLLDAPAAFLGVIGSKRRWIVTRNGLLAAGVSEEKLKQVYSPIGLELNAETPEEIAVSILAEIIMLRNGGSGKSMKM
jgi:xanthine dehydrogenase accessory factor